MKEEKAAGKKSMIKQIVIVLVCVFGIRLVLGSFMVQGASMEPYFSSGDKILVEKLSPHFGGIELNDVILCDNEHAPGQVELKRVIGLPGDVMEIHDKQIWLNGQLVPHSFTDEPDHPEAEVIPAKTYFTTLGISQNAKGLDQASFEFVKSDFIIGTAMFRFWPFSHKAQAAP